MFQGAGQVFGRRLQDDPAQAETGAGFERFQFARQRVAIQSAAAFGEQRIGQGTGAQAAAQAVDVAVIVGDHQGRLAVLRPARNQQGLRRGIGERHADHGGGEFLGRRGQRIDGGRRCRPGLVGNQGGSIECRRLRRARRWRVVQQSLGGDDVEQPVAQRGVSFIQRQRGDFIALVEQQPPVAGHFGGGQARRGGLVRGEGAVELLQAVAAHAFELLLGQPLAGELLDDGAHFLRQRGGVALFVR